MESIEVIPLTKNPITIPNDQEEEVKTNPLTSKVIPSQDHQNNENKLPINPFDNTFQFSPEVIKIESTEGIVGYAMQYIEPYNLFCIGTKKGDILLYDATDFKLIGKYNAVHQGWIISLTYSPRPNLLISTSTDKLIKAFKVEATKIVEVAKMEGHKDNVNGVLLLPEDLMISCGRDSGLKVWDLKTFQLKREIPTGEGGMGCLIIKIEELNSVGVSFNSGKIKLYDVDTGACIRILDTSNPKYYINSLLYLPKRRWIVAQTSTKEIKIWQWHQDEFIERGKIRTEGHANCIYVDEEENNIVVATDKPFLDVYELDCLSRTNKIHFGPSPIKNSNGLVYIPTQSKIVVSAWNSPHLCILKISPNNIYN